MTIERYTEKDWEALARLWEASVRSTHAFLSEEDVRFFRGQLKEHYLPQVEVYVERDDERNVRAFMGLSGEMIEMLFVHPDAQGCGVGARLVRFAVEERGMRYVDVNEQNETAYRFYLHRGFQVIGRDEHDATGRPFPILHLSLDKR